MCLDIGMRDEEKLSGTLSENSINHSSKVDLNNLMKKLKEEEKLTKRNNLVISAAALSAVAVFGIIMTL
tara:strand:+ start:2491 stop:2697 length:207 start_codon:yes stop_codon:yes gene_type:complete